MALLLYCVADLDAPPTGALEGVSGLPLLRHEGHGLITFISRSSSPEVWVKRPVAEAALEFHHVLQELFRATAILPFRFPSTIESERELQQHLEERAPQYQAALQKFRNLVQLEARIVVSGGVQDGRPAPSGTEYLREKERRASALSSFASTCEVAAAGSAEQWRTRALPNGLRLFALVDRERTRDFRGALERVPVPPGLSLRISGPWPVTEFLN
jgi:gas vesicle protein GvpL/GvpF